MKKALVPLIVVLIIAAVIGFAIMPSTPQASQKLQSEITEALSSGKTVFLQLSSSGCVTCRKMKPGVEQIMADYANSSEFMVLNIDVDSHTSIASQYGVSAVPTQVLLAPSGKEVFRNMGYMSYDNIKYVMASTPTK
ncbi:MAG: thioredoxin family protein [Deferribacterales bacterium]|jgi:thioredoxin 1